LHWPPFLHTDKYLKALPLLTVEHTVTSGER
jgi:hypothetical protein